MKAEIKESRVAREAYGDIMRGRARGRLPGGVRAGLRAGLIVAVAAALRWAAQGDGPAYPAKLVAAAWLGTPALISGTVAATAGLTVHLALAALLGSLFVWWARPFIDATSRWLVAGLAYGVALWLGATYLALPAFDPTMRMRMMLEPASWLALHALFGVSLAAAARAATVRPCDSAEGSEAGR